MIESFLGACLTMNLGDTIQRLRADRGLSSGQLAKLSGVSRGYLWQLETGGKEKPSFDVLERVAAALGVDVSEFSEQEVAISDIELPSGLAEFARAKSKELGIRKADIELMKTVHFRGKQPQEPEDWELLFLFLKKWAK